MVPTRSNVTIRDQSDCRRIGSFLTLRFKCYLNVGFIEAVNVIFIGILDKDISALLFIAG